MDQVVMITGAAQGIGFVLAQTFAEAGYQVVVSDITLALAEKAKAELNADANKVLALKLDVCVKSDFEQALQASISHFGRLDVLINNAAMTPTTALMDISPEEFSTVMDINLRGTFLGCQVVCPYLAEQKRGRVINMASLAGQMGGTASGAHYASSKAGIMTLTKVFARHFAAEGVTVNSIAPGPVDVASLRDKVPEEKLNHIINNVIPMKTMSDPQYIAQMALLMAAEHGQSVTGTTWDINGGIFMR